MKTRTFKKTFEILCCMVHTPQVANNESGKAWKTWFDSEAPEDTPIPDGYQGSLDTFRKLLLIRAWCPDRTINQARRYITDSIGKEVKQCVYLK